MLHVYRQISGLQNWRSVVICQKREEEARFPFSPVTILPKPWSRALRRFFVKQLLGRPVQIYPWEAERIRREVRAYRGDVLHIYFGHIAVQLLPLLRKPPVPIVVSFHGADAMVDMEKPAYRAATLEMLDLAKLLLVRSESLAERLRDLGCPPEKIRIHRTGIPLDRFPYQEREFPTDGNWRFFQACRLIPKKGLPTALKAFASFAAEFPKAEFVIAGEGPMLEELKNLAASLGVSEKVHFPGFLTQDALREEFYKAHAFLHPSEVGSDGNQEGVPNSMLEAMATGLPVLATYHGGIPEAVDNGVSGWLVPERDDAGLAEGMRRWAKDSACYVKMGRAASRSVTERFKQENQVAVLEGIYTEALTT